MRRGLFIPMSSVAFLSLSAALALSGEGQPASAEASTPASADESEAAAITALIAGTLDPAVAPLTLFDVDLSDDQAVQVAATRLKLLLRGLEDEQKTESSERPNRKSKAAPSILAALDPDLWRAHLDLDHARLSFYELPPTRRSEILAAHERRQAPSPDLEKSRALAAARLAHSESEKLVAGELVRLLGVGQNYDALAQRFVDEKTTLAELRDSVIGWQRRARDAKADRSQADALYDALRIELRDARDRLSAALEALSSNDSDVIALGPDPLQDIASDIDATRARKARVELQARADVLRETEHALRAERASALLDEVDALNRERLALLPSLSAGKQAAITGFTLIGWKQARSEARHLFLIVRYHRYAIGSWIARLRSEQGARGKTILRSGAIVLPWAAAIGFFLWWRRRSERLLAAIEQSLEEADRKARRPSASGRLRAFRFVRAVRSPLEWLALFTMMLWLLPNAAHGVLEVQILRTIITWTLAGAFVVDALNAGFALAPLLPRSTADKASSALRLRSLRFIGRVVVGLVLTLLISAKLVGEGTIYRWVLSTCWLASLPVALVLVRWWRETVFARIDRLRKKSRFERWALAHRTGWMSFVAAMAAAAHLLAAGTVHTFRHWLNAFEWVRRGRAYLFRRELDKKDKQLTVENLAPLEDELFKQLGPDIVSAQRVAIVTDEQLDRFAERARSRLGGILALVGERGSGKTTSLNWIRDRVEGAAYVDCLAQDVAALDPRAPLLLDNVQKLIQPVMGGLRQFDELMVKARAASQSAPWILAIDASVWPLIAAARGTKPLFDEVLTLGGWLESEIGELLRKRNKEVSVVPDFQDLLQELPPDADDIDRSEALAERENAFYRLIWDHSRGNPAVALQVWRESLARAPTGALRVRPLQAPFEGAVETLTDTSLFVLRSALQFSGARFAEIQASTNLPPAQISDALRYSLSHGFIQEIDGRISLTWRWYRAVTRVLERRHLTVTV